MMVYQLEHEYELLENGVIYDMITRIAIYSTKEKAKRAIERLRSHPKFKDHPENFHIYETEVDTDFWQEGFNSWDD